MFSDNQKISGRQLNRMLALDLFAAASMLLPKFLVHTSGGAGLYAIAAGTACVIAYSGLIYYTASMYNDNLFEFIKRTWNAAAAWIVMVYFMIRFLFSAVYFLKMFSRVINQTFITEIPEKFMGALMLIIAYYSVSRGIEARGRFGSLLLWIVVIPILFVVALAIPQIDLSHVFPMELPSVRGITGGSLAVIAAFGPVEFLLLAVPYVRSRRRGFHFVVGAVVFGALITAVIYLVCVGVLSIKGALSEQWPSVILMQIVRLPGRFMSRQDGLMLSFWIASAFMAVSGYIFYAGESIRQMISGRCAGFVFGAWLVLVYGAFCMIKDYTAFEQFYFKMSLWGGCVPTVVILIVLVISNGAAVEKVRKRQRHDDKGAKTAVPRWQRCKNSSVEMAKVRKTEENKKLKVNKSGEGSKK